MPKTTWAEVEAMGYTGPVYRIDVVVFDLFATDDGTDATGDADYWCNDEETELSDYECLFLDLDEAREYAAAFDEEMAVWHLTHGNGRKYDHVSCEVTQCLWDGAEHYPDYVVTCHDWLFGRRHEAWHYEECEGRMGQ